MAAGANYRVAAVQGGRPRVTPGGARHAAGSAVRQQRHDTLLRLSVAVSTDFVGLSQARADDAVNALLGKIGSYAGVDRAYLFQLTDDGTQMNNTHEWCAPGVEPMMAMLQDLPVDLMPWWMEQLQARDYLHIPKVSDLPDAAEAERSTLEMQAIQSLIVVPLRAGDRLFGFMGFDATSPTHTWLEHDIALLRMIGEVLVNAFQRWKTESALIRRDQELAEMNQQLEARIAERTDQLRRANANLAQMYRMQQAILQNASAMIVATDAAGTVTIFNAAAERLLGYTAGEMVGVATPERWHDPAGWPTEGTTAERITALLAKEASEEGLECQFVRKDGSRFPAHVMLAPLPASDGTPTGFIAVASDISSRRKAEEQLALHSHILGAVQDGIIVYDTDGKVIYWNPGAEALLGYSAGAMIGVDMMPELVTGWRAAAAGAFLPLLSEGKSWSGEFDLRRADGTSFPGLITLSPLQGPHRLRAVIVSIKDMAALRKAEQSLRDQEQRLELALQGADLGTWDWNIGTNEVIVNERWREMLGLRHLDASNGLETWSSRMHPDDVAAVNRALQAHLEGQAASYSSEHRLLHNDGHWIWVLDSGKVIERDDDGRPLRACGTHMDITQRKHAEDALRASEERFRLIAESTTDVITIRDVAGQLLYVSPSIRYFGYEPDQLLVAEPEDFIHPDDQPKLDESIAQMAASMAPYVVNSFRMRNGAGQYQWAESTTNPVRNAEGTPTALLSVTRDISRRVQAEAQLRSALEAQLEVTEIRTRMIAVASHEYRTPLAGILAVAETLSAYRARLTDQQIDDRLNMIRNQVAHLTRITEDVLNLSRLQGKSAQPRPEPVRLDELCARLVNGYAQDHGKGHTVAFINNAGTLEIDSDPALLKMILSNLVENATKYSPEGTPVRVELAAVADAAVLRVVDRGIGIPEEEQARLFLPFFRASNVGTTQGTGLGLPIAHEAIRRLGGDIAVQSQVGRGSTFVVTIPRRMPPSVLHQSIIVDAE
jgi:PAS domain S-box-containing protein